MTYFTNRRGNIQVVDKSTPYLYTPVTRHSQPQENDPIAPLALGVISLILGLIGHIYLL